MAIERGGVVGLFIAECGAKRRDARGVADQAIEEIMPGFMAEMAEQRAIRLVKRGACFLSMRVVGFGDVERDDAVVMARHYAVTLRVAFEKLKFEAALGIFLTRLHRKAELGKVYSRRRLAASMRYQ